MMDEETKHLNSHYFHYITTYLYSVYFMFCKTVYRQNNCHKIKYNLNCNKAVSNNINTGDKNECFFIESAY